MWRCSMAESMTGNIHRIKWIPEGRSGLWKLKTQQLLVRKCQWPAKLCTPRSLVRTQLIFAWINPNAQIWLHHERWPWLCLSCRPTTDSVGKPNKEAVPSSVSPSASSHFVCCVCLSLLCLPSLCLRNGAAEVGRNVGHRHRSDFTFFLFDL